MNNKELQAARMLLFLSVKEASEQIGRVSARSWQRWEKGDQAVPKDVEGEMLTLCAKRTEMIDDIEDLAFDEEATVEMAYYMTFNEYRIDHRGASIIDWRLSQSVAAYFFGDGVGSLS